jgi:phage head maturation protease
MQHDGQPVYIRGYSAVFDRPSVPIEDNGGRREIVRPSAFDRFVRNPPFNLKCVVHHLEGPGLVASTYAGTLKLWTDSHGLAFEAGPLKATTENYWLLEAVVTGRLRGCSWLATPADYRIETIDDEEFRVIEDFKSVDHIGPVETGAGAYRDACCWASHEDLKDLTPELQQVIDYWEHSHAARRKPMLVATAHARARAVVAPRAMTDEEIYGPPPIGMTMDQWLDFGQSCAHGARAMR